MKKEIKRFRCSIEKVYNKQRVVSIRIINHPNLVYYRLPFEFFDKIGFIMDHFWFIVFDDETVMLKLFNEN